MSDLIDKIRSMKQDYYNRQVPKVTFNPLEKKEEPEKEEPKDDGSLLSKIKAKAKSDAKESIGSEKDKQLIDRKIAVKEDYLTLYRNQMKAGNLILTDSISEIDKVFREMLKEDESYNMDNLLLRSEKQDRAVMRNQKREFLQLSKGRLQKVITNDIVNFFTSRYRYLDEAELNNIEVIEEVKLTKDTLTLITSEGEYELESRKMSYYGGYIYLNRNMLTEHLDLEKISKDMLMKNAKRVADAQTKAWLMVSPMCVPINDKLLLLPLDYLKDSLTSFLTNIKEFEAKKTKVFKDNKEGIHDEYKEVEHYMKQDSRSIVESLIALETPVDRAVIMFPYNRLAENGVKFESNIDFNSENYVSVLEDRDADSVDFISWDSVKELRETTNIEGKLIELMKIFGKLTRPDLVDTSLDIANIDDIKLMDEEITTDEQVSNKFRQKLLKDYQLLEEEKPDLDGEESAEDSGYDDKKSKKKATDFEEKNRKSMKKHAKRLFDMDFGIIDEVISEIKASEYFNRDWSIPMESIKNSITDLNFNTDDNLYNKYLAIEFMGNAGGTPDIKVAVDFLEGMTKNKIESLKVLEKFLKEYTEHRNKISEIQSVIGSAIKYTYLNNLELNLKSDYSVLRLSPIIIENLLNRFPELKTEVDDLQKYAIPVMNPNLTKYEYEKIRSIIKHLGDRPQVNWIEILKVVALRESSLLKSYIRLFDDVKSLANLPEIKDDMVRLFGAKKFIPATDTEITEEEKMFNTMFNEIAVRYKGLLCSIDYKGVIWYIVNTEEPLQGDEIIKYIPSLRVVNKYFPITESGRVYDKIEPERLVSEISNIPAVYLALNHILNTVNGILKFEPDIFMEEYDIIHEYEILKRDLSTKVANMNQSVSGNLDIEHDEILNKLELLLKELRGKRNFEKKSDNMLSLPRRPKDAIKFILDNPYYYNFGDKDATPPISSESEVKQYREKLDTLSNRLKEVDEQIVVNKAKSFEYNKKIIEEQSEKVKELKAVIDENVGNAINNVIDKLSQYYNPNTSYKDFMNAWKFYKFDKFPKGRILFNFIKTYVEDNSDIVKSAIFNILRQYLLDSKGTLDALKSKSKNEIDAYTGVFGVMSYIFKLDRVLTIESADTVELQSAIDDEKPQIMSEEDKAILNIFLQEIGGKSDDDISKAFRGFERKELLDDDLYLNLAYNNLDELDKLYPTWYNRDFNIAENLKIMLMCGVPMDSLSPEHRADNKLMGIVKDTEIDPQYVAKILDFLKEV